MKLEELLINNTYKKIVFSIVKRLSIGNYSIKNNNCSVEVILDTGTTHEITISNRLTRRELVSFLSHNRPDFGFEPTVKNFESLLENNIIDPNSTRKQLLIEFLKQYKDKHTKLGRELPYKTLYKLYSTNESDLNPELREIHGARFIDYEKQLKQQKCKFKKIIYDENKFNGIWAMSQDYLLKCANLESINNYGNNLLILKPIRNSKYFIFKTEDDKGEMIEEIIGEKFQVLESANLKVRKPDELAKIFKNKIEKYNSSY